MMAWNWKQIAAAATTAAAVLAIISSWIALGFPLVATRGYVAEKLRPIIYRQLVNQRHIDNLDLYQWQSSNPTPSAPVQEQINKLRAEIGDLDRQIAVMEQ